MPAGEYSRRAQIRRWEADLGRTYGAKHRTVDIPFWTAPTGYCRACGTPLDVYLKDGRRDIRSRWHPGCSAEYLAQQPGNQHRRITARDGRECRQCGVTCGNGNFGDSGPPYEIDHVVPLIDGGSNSDENLQVLCVPCHKTKTAEEATRRAAQRRRGGQDRLPGLHGS